MNSIKNFIGQIEWTIKFHKYFEQKYKRLLGR